jgi:ribosomal protein L19
LPPTINFVGTVILALCRSARRSKLVHKKKKRIHSVNINFPIFQPELKQVNT